MMMPGSASAHAPSTSAWMTSVAVALGGVDRRLLAHFQPPGDRQADADQDARHDAGEEQLRDRQAGRDAEDDEADRRRDDRPDDAAGGDEPRGLGRIVAGLDHHRKQQRGKRGRVGDGRARQRGQDARGEDHDIAEAASYVPHQRERHVDDAFRQAAGVHDLACQQEERGGHQREAVGAGDEVLRDDLRVHHVELVHERDAAHEQRERDRHSERHGAQKREQEDGDGHDGLRQRFLPADDPGPASCASTSPANSASTSSSDSRTWIRSCSRHLSGHRPPEVSQKETAGGDAKEDADAVVEPP